MNVAYIITNKFFNLSYVSITSFLLNNKKNDINLYIVYDETVSKNKIDAIKHLKKYKNVSSLNFVEIDSKKYADFFFKHNVFYCFELAELVNVDKMLFLHNDNLITQDLKELYDTDIENVPCATTEFVYPLKQNLKSEQNNFVLSCATLLLNCKYIREHKYFEKLMSKEFLKKVVKFKVISDLVIFNNLVEGAKQIPIDYGYEEFWFIKAEIQGCEETKELYNEYLTHKKTPAIVCYDGVEKPLSRKCKHSYLKLWWKYARKSFIYKNIKYFEPKTRFQYLFSRKGRVRLMREYKEQQNNQIILFITKYVKPYWFRTLIALGLAIPIGCLDAVIAMSLKPYMDIVMIEKNTKSSWYIPILIIVFTSFQGILNYLSTYMNDWVSGRISNDLKLSLYDKLMRKSATFFDTKTSGDIQKRFNNDANLACGGLLNNIKLIISKVFSSVSLVGVLFYNSWQLAIVSTVILITAILPALKMKETIKSVANMSENANAAIFTDYNEAYNGSKIVKAFNLYDLRKKLFTKDLKNVFNLKMKITQRTGVIAPIMHVIVSLGIGLSIGYGSHLITTGVITPGNFVSFITALIMLYTPIKSLGNSAKSMTTSLLALERVYRNLEAPDYIVDSANSIEFQGLHDRITFENVSFAYVKDKPVLKKINFEVKKGETLALVGNSGGGKSTIVSLLPRFYKLKWGSIKIDGIDIADYKINSLRDNIAIVLQDNFLFAGTIRENILMGKLNATKNELDNAVKNACLDEFIDSLKNGLDTYIGEKGVLLSGGQKQRIAIARAFLKDAPIIILDEATSALDNQSEAIVQKAIDNLMQDKTVFVIAHRLSTIQNADRIAVINEGKLVELGSHDELMQIENGQYKKLYEMQFNKRNV